MSEASAFIDPATMVDPSNFFRSLRNEKPVYFDETLGAWIVSRHHDVASVLTSPEIFSNRLAYFTRSEHENALNEVLTAKGIGPFIEVPPMTDPPAHGRMRRLIAPAFSPKRIKKFQDYIEDLSSRLIDSALSKESVDFVSEIAVPMPVAVIADMLCVPENRVDDIKRWTRAYTAYAGNRIQSDEEARQVGEQLAEMQNYILSHIKERRNHSEDDVLGDLVSARSEEGDTPLSDGEIVAIAAAFLVAGHETSTVAVTAIAKFFAENKDYITKLRNSENQDGDIRQFCEEIMRLNPPVRMLPRVAVEDVTIGEAVIPKESFVLVLMASGNEDEGVFGADAGSFCPGRKNANKHHSFGFGPHMCVGNMLARAELKTITRLLVEKVDEIEIVEDISLESFEPVVLDINLQLKRLMLRLTPRQ